MNKILSNKQILCVDDDPMNIVILTYFLEQLGAEIITASSGEIAAQKINTKTQIAIVDIMMPTISGNDLAKQFLISHPHVPLISYTCSEESVGKNIFHFNLPKPFNKQELIDIILGAFNHDDLFNGEYKDVCVNTSELLESPGFAENILPGIKQHLIEQHSDLQTMVMSHDMDKIKFCLHKLKGGSYMAGFKTLGNLVKDTEQMHKESNNLLFAAHNSYLKNSMTLFANSPTEFI